MSMMLRDYVIHSHGMFHAIAWLPFGCLQGFKDCRDEDGGQLAAVAVWLPRDRVQETVYAAVHAVCCPAAK